jgi:hypothetical protein
MMAIDCLNKIQKEEDPSMYEPEVAKNLQAMKIRKQREEELRREKDLIERLKIEEKRK